MLSAEYVLKEKAEKESFWTVSVTNSTRRRCSVFVDFGLSKDVLNVRLPTCLLSYLLFLPSGRQALSEVESRE